MNVYEQFVVLFWISDIGGVAGVSPARRGSGRHDKAQRLGAGAQGKAFPSFFVFLFNFSMNGFMTTFLKNSKKLESV